MTSECVCNSGDVRDSGGNVHDSRGMSATVRGNVHKSGEIEDDLGNLTVELVIHNCAQITSEGTWNNI